MRINTLIIALILLATTACHGSNYYVAQTAQGAGNGTAAADAYALTWLNNTANWGVGGGVNPGDTVHLVGTFTSGVSFSGATSGTLGNPVTLLFEPGANFTAPYWGSPGGAIYIAGCSNIVIDGGTNGTWVTNYGHTYAVPNGIIQCTANGNGLTYSNNTYGITGPASGNAGYGANIVIQNLIFTNFFNRTLGLSNSLTTGYPIAIAGNCITISNCFISDGDGLLSLNALNNQHDSNFFVLNNVFLNYNHGIGFGLPDGFNGVCGITNVVVSGNYIDHSDRFDWQAYNPAANPPWAGQNHMDGLYVVGNSSAGDDPYMPQMYISGVQIYNNVFGPHVSWSGQQPGVTGATSAISTYGSWMATNWYVYNNLVVQNASNYWEHTLGAPGTNAWVVNNTVIGATNSDGSFPATSDGDLQGQYGYNNIILNTSDAFHITGSLFGVTSLDMSTGSSILSNLNLVMGSSYSDRNVYNLVDAGGMVMVGGDTNTGWIVIWQAGESLGNFHDWQTYYENEWGWPTPNFNQIHCDPNAIIGTPTFNPGAYVLATNDTVAASAGTNLSFLVAQAPALAYDAAGQLRPTSGVGNWDIGAFQAEAYTPPPPSTAKRLRVRKTH